MDVVVPAGQQPGSLPGGPLPRAPHEHEMRLVAVAHEDGLATSEYVCTGCGTTWFA